MLAATILQEYVSSLVEKTSEAHVDKISFSLDIQPPGQPPITKDDTAQCESSEQFDVVLVCHSLYGNEAKIDLLQHACLFARNNGGIVIVVHRAAFINETSDTLQQANSDSLYICKYFDTKLSIPQHFSCRQRQIVEKYTKLLDVSKPIMSSKNSSLHQYTFSTGILMIERDLCIATKGSIDYESSRHRVKSISKTNVPYGVITPYTHIGVAAAVFYAYRHKLKVSVIGGGHSDHCHQNGVLSVDLVHLNRVVVNESEQTVMAGGGGKF